MFSTNRTNIKELYKPAPAISVSGDGKTVSFEDKTISIGNAISSDPDVILNVKGNTKVDGTINTNEIVITSDYRLKSNVEPLDDNMNVNNLNPVSYCKINSSKKEIGFIAHELQEELPYLVNGNKDGDKFQNVNYIGLIGILVKEMQNLKKRVSDLEKNNYDN
jgi:hypothetical protein